MGACGDPDSLKLRMGCIAGETACGLLVRLLGDAMAGAVWTLWVAALSALLTQPRGFAHALGWTNASRPKQAAAALAHAHRRFLFALRSSSRNRARARPASGCQALASSSADMRLFTQ